VWSRRPRLLGNSRGRLFHIPRTPNLHIRCRANLVFALTSLGEHKVRPYGKNMSDEELVELV